MDIQVSPVTVTTIDGRLRVAINGPIHTNVAWLERELDRVVAREPKLVELDLSTTTFVSSLGIGSLIAFRSGLTKSGGSLRVIAVQKSVYNALAFCHLLDSFGLSPDCIITTKA